MRGPRIATLVLCAAVVAVASLAEAKKLKTAFCTKSEGGTLKTTHFKPEDTIYVYTKWKEHGNFDVSTKWYQPNGKHWRTVAGRLDEDHACYWFCIYSKKKPLPEGKWKVEVYEGDKLSDTLFFTVKE
jgi:hypothetical protein